MLFRSYFKSKVLVHPTGNKYIQVFALTNEKKNKAFFRLGDAVDVVPSMKERKNPTTETAEEYVNKVEKILSQPPKKRGRPKKTDEQKVADSKRKEMVQQMKKRGRPAKNKKEG